VRHPLGAVRSVEYSYEPSNVSRRHQRCVFYSTKSRQASKRTDPVATRSDTRSRHDWAVGSGTRASDHMPCRGKRPAKLIPGRPMGRGIGRAWIVNAISNPTRNRHRLGSDAMPVLRCCHCCVPNSKNIGAFRPILETRKTARWRLNAAKAYPATYAGLCRPSLGDLNAWGNIRDLTLLG
jgi:hypothetical protein